MREWITGRNPVYETLRARRRHVFRLQLAQNVKETDTVRTILKLSRSRKIPIERVPRDALDARFSHNHQGVALEASGYPYRTLPDILAHAEKNAEPPFVLLLDTLQDPQNLGTLLRTAEAVGIHGVCLPKRRTATVTPAVVNASSGASEHLIIAQLNLARAIDELKECGAWVIGLDHGPQAQLPGKIRLDGALVLVVGNEGEGLRKLTKKSCDLLLKLPMRGQIESLNAAVAGSVALFLAWQARQYSPGKTVDGNEEI